MMTSYMRTTKVSGHCCFDGHCLWLAYSPARRDGCVPRPQLGSQVLAHHQYSIVYTLYAAWICCLGGAYEESMTTFNTQIFVYADKAFRHIAVPEKKSPLMQTLEKSSAGPQIKYP